MLGQEIAGIFVRLGADISDFQRGMETATRDMAAVGRKMQNIGKTLSMSVTAPFAVMGGVAVNAWDKQAKAMAQVENGIKSTGGVARLTMEQLTKAATDLQKNTLFGDEEILQKATAQLLTFTNIAGDEFLRTQRIAADLASKLGGDLQSASIQLGKALNDPVANLSALSRSGIQFSKDQKEVIKSLAESGKLAEAQNVILSELERQYGGTAAAAAKAGLGPFTQLKNIIGDLSEDFGKLIAEALMPFAEKVKGVVVWLQQLSPEAKKATLIVGGLAAAIGPLTIALGTLATMLPVLATGFTALTGPIGIVIAAIGGLTAAYFALNSVGNRMSKEDALSKPLDQLLEKRNELERKLPELKKRLKEIQDMGGDVHGGASFKTRDELQQVEKELKNVRQAIRENQLAEKDKRLAAIKGAQEQVAAETALKAATDATTSGIEEQTGKLPKLEAELQKATEALNALPEGATDADFARINRNIADLTARIERLKNVTLTSIAPIAAIESKGPVNMAVKMDASIPDRDFAALQERMQKFREGLVYTKDIAVETTQVMQQSIVDMATTVGQSFANLLTNTDSIGGFFQSILSVVADFGKQLGKLIVAQGAAMLALKSSLFKSPIATIAAGTALIAASSIMSNLIKAGPAVPGFANGVNDFRGGMAIVGERGPELVNLPRGADVIPNHKLAGMGNSGTGRVEFEIRGDKLYGVLQNYNTKAGKLF